jgi:predicted DNA-binding transcriptional regulator YafY
VVESAADGSITVTYPVTNLEGFRSYVLSFLDHAEVLGPAVAREAMVAWLTELSDQADLTGEPA